MQQLLSLALTITLAASCTASPGTTATPAPAAESAVGSPATTASLGAARQDPPTMTSTPLPAPTVEPTAALTPTPVPRPTLRVDPRPGWTPSVPLSAADAELFNGLVWLLNEFEEAAGIPAPVRIRWNDSGIFTYDRINTDVGKGLHAAARALPDRGNALREVDSVRASVRRWPDEVKGYYSRSILKLEVASQALSGTSSTAVPAPTQAAVTASPSAATAPSPLAVPGATVRASFEGVASGGSGGAGGVNAHPDHGIAAGPRSVLLVSNNVVAIRDKAGSLMASMSTGDFFRPALPPGVNVGGDPWMTFDPSSQRFFYVTDGSAGNGHVVQCRPGTCQAYHLLAVSKSADPRGLDPADWHFYALDRTLLRTPAGTVQTANWGDWDNIAVDADTVVITWPAYKFGVASGGADQSQGAKVRILAKASLLRGDRITTWTDLEITDPTTGAKSLEKIEPVTGSSDTAPFFIIAMRGCDMLIWGLESPLGSPALRGHTVRQDCQGAYGIGAAQPGSAAPIDVVPNGHNVAYSNGSLWYSHLVKSRLAGGEISAIRWIQVDVSAWPDAPRRVQEGIIQEDRTWLLSPAVVVDGRENAVIVFGSTSTTEYPSLNFTFRTPSDPLGRMRPTVLIKEGSRSWEQFSTFTGSRNRWVDFFAAALDPVDDSSWVFGAYVTPEGRRGTWVANIVLGR